jgi:1-acyl-sn-glycerol-3-phosphate acyltransferase
MPQLADASLLRRRFDGTYIVDEWGLDRDLVRAVAPLLSVRWRIDAVGADVLPRRGPVLLVANRRLGWSEPFVLSRGVGLATGRHVRVAGVPDVAPLGPALRRLGGVLSRPDEVAGLLRAGQAVGVFLERSRRRDHAGAAPAELLAAAATVGVDIVPVAVTGCELGRSWQLVVGPAIEHTTSGDPLSVLELCDRTRAGVQSMLDGASTPFLSRIV